jgi:hypothetical protein
MSIADPPRDDTNRQNSNAKQPGDHDKDNSKPQCLERRPAVGETADVAATVGATKISVTDESGVSLKTHCCN